MIIHCLACGKAVSSHSHSCPYCMSQVTEITRELNGIAEKERLGERLRGMVFGIAQK